MRNANKAKNEKNEEVEGHLFSADYVLQFLLAGVVVVQVQL